jgi:amino acid adenylation domain-containing protein/non-ribosomal peptide synthase protein (TIGR01720 family)
VRFIEESGLTGSVQISYSNFVELTCSRADEKPDRTAYVFLQDGENESGRLTFAQLDRRARAVAAKLQSMGMTGERALLLYPPGLDYIVGFFGCLYAGVVAVPASPPARRQRSRLLAVFNDAAPAVIMTTTDLAVKFRNEFACGSDAFVATKAASRDEGVAPTIPEPAWFATDNLEAESAGDWVKPALNANSLAFLQYTSGSTGDPKGVMVSHGNLMANQKAIKQGFEHTEHTTVVGWLPLYHDMGLIGNLLQPLYLGTTAILMPPMAFLEKPVRWLKAISNYRANTSGGPNFAYDLCLRKVTAEQMQELDLSAWTLAFNGSEPVHAATMERFAEKFADRGFRRESFFPCYGLAEATLFVSGAHLPSEGDAQHAEDKPINRPVSCGATSHHHEIRIVDPETGSLCREGHVGEIRVAGPSIAQGYWNRPDESEHTFRARTIDTEDADHQNIGARFSTEKNTEQAFLRTGDLGFLHNGRLHITGRIKDLIIIRGRNVYPQDIEQALVEEIQALIPDGCVAFSINHEDEEQLIVVAEITRAAMRSGDYEAIAAAMRKVLAEVCELAAAECVLVQPGTVLKTSSGKIRRQPCKQMYLENSLPVLFRSGEGGATHSKTMVESGSLSSQLHFAGSEVGRVAAVHGGIPQFQILQQALLAVPQAQRTVLITRFLSQKIALLLKIEASALPADSSLRALGLDSLKAVELKHEADELLGIDAPLSLFLSDDSLEKIAEILSEIAEFTAGDSTAQVSMGHTEISVHSRSGLSATQFSMWTMQQLEPNSIVYNLHLALRIAGTLDQERLKHAFRYLMDRHPLLRTLYRADANNEIIQQVLPTSELPEFFTAIDASAWTESRLQDDMARRAREPFDLEAGPLFRTTYYQQGKTRSGRDTDGQSLLTETGNILLICAHHIAVDLWSVLILVSELKTIYADLSLGQEPRLNNLNSSYTDFAVWQRQYLKSPSCDKAWTYWQRQLTGELPLLSLPTDRPRPVVAESCRAVLPDTLRVNTNSLPADLYRGASVAFRLDRDETERLKKLAGQQGVTLFALLLTAYKVLLHRYTYQQDLIVGVPASGRPQARFASVVGNFVNPLPLRSSPSGNKAFSAYLAEVNGALLGALEHQDFPFSRLVERLQPERVADHWPIYQTLFVLQQAQAGFDTDLAQLALGEDGEFSDWGTMRAGPLAIQQRVENFDVKLMAAECQDGLQFSFQYRCDLFEKDTITNWGGHFQRLLAGIVADCDMKLDDLPLLSADERNRLVAWNATETDYSGTCCLHRLFEAQVEKIPDQIALIYQDRQLTYRELNARSNRLANALIAAKFGPDTPIGICAERSLEMVVGLLGILKAGCAYLPLDPEYPQERLSAMLNDADAPLILAQPEFAPIFSGFTGAIYRLDAGLTDFTGYSERNPDVRIGDETLAYVLFTSGSTGRPKGVGVPHKGVRNRLLWMQDYFGLDAGDAVLQKTPYTFDVSVWEFFWPLLSGARLVMAAPGDHKDPERLVELIERHAVTTLHFVPSMLGAFLNVADFDRCGSLGRVICSGEVLTADLQKRFYQCIDAGLFNLYGPTEASIDVTVWRCRPSQSETPMPIGRPIANTQVYLLDSHLNPVPVGVAGEIYLGGIQLARGYLNQPGLSAERFVPNPFAETGERLYRTGDLARYRRNGVIDYLGRIDHQVKIRGFRIELGEIEAVLLQHPAVSEAAVIVREDGPGDKYLAAYWVSNQSSVPDMDVLQDFLKARLPDYMIPTVLMELERLPLTGNGKLDRKALPALDFDLQFADQYEAPRNEAEKVLARIWSDVLRIERIGIHDNFFALGGDSILAIQVAGRARQAGLAFVPRQLFELQTVAELAEAITQSRPRNFEQDDTYDDAPLTPIQHWFFEQNFANPNHWNQSVLLEVKTTLDMALLEKAFDCLVSHHDALRLRFNRKDGVWHQASGQNKEHSLLRRVDMSAVPEADKAGFMDAECNRSQASLDVSQGPLLQAIWFDRGEHQSARLFIVIHHLVVDGVSWRILLDDLQSVYFQLSTAKTAVLPAKTTSFKHWAEQLNAFAKSGALQSEADYWLDSIAANPASLPVDHPEGARLEGVTASCSDELSEAGTQALLRDTLITYRTSVDDLLLVALVQTLSEWCGSDSVFFDREAHGREALFDDIDVSSTAGWFTSVYPLCLRLPEDASIGDTIKSIRAQLSRIPGKGIGYGLLRYASLPDVSSKLAAAPKAQLLFNYLGRLDEAFIDAPWHLASEAQGASRDADNSRAYELEINAYVSRGKLRTEWRYSAERYQKETVAGLAGRFTEILQGLVDHCLAAEPAGLMPSDFPLAALDQETLDTLPYAASEIEDIYPLSPMQEGMLFDTLMAPRSGIYLMQDRFDVHGVIDETCFQRAWQMIIDRHTALRTGFLWETSPHPVQIVHRHVDLPFEYHDWRLLNSADRQDRLETMLAEERQQGFDFLKPPLMTVRLIRLAEERYCFVRSYHHILIDAWCMSLMLVELMANYKALSLGQLRPQLPAPRFQSYIAWLQKQDKDAAKQFWQRYLHGMTESTPFNVDKLLLDAEKGKASVADAIVFLSAQNTKKLNAMAQQYRVTPNTFVQAAWAVMLSRYSGRGEVVFGVTVSGRPPELPGSEDMLGVFINTLPLRVAVDMALPVAEFLSGLLRQNIELRQYEYSQLVQIQSWSEIPREQPLFESLLVFENYPVDPSLRSNESALNIVDVATRTHTNYPLNGMVIPGERLHLQITYHTNRFETAAVERMLGHFRNLLEGMIANPEQRICEIPLLAEEERRLMLQQWNRTVHAYPEPCDTITQFESVAARKPDAVAVAYLEKQLTYGELNKRVNRVAHALMSEGADPEMLIALFSERGIDYLVMMLGAFKAGMAYLPFDPSHPDGRIAQVLKESGAAWVLTCESNFDRASDLADRAGETAGAVQQAPRSLGLQLLSRPDVLVLEELESGENGTENPPKRHGPDNLAFVIFTSGSTGKPKGAMVEYKGMFNNLITKVPALDLTEQDVIAQTAGQCFDISVWQHLTALVCGARVEILPDEIVKEPYRLLAQLGESGVTVLEAVPSMIQALLDSVDILGLPELRWLIACGEAFSPELCRRWMERMPHVKVLNAYGPAECSDDVSYYEVPAIPSDAETIVPIGRPVHNTRLYLLNRWLEPVPVGVPGEICVTGIQVGRGYLDRPDLTAEKFIPDPFDETGCRMYRTGDLGRYREDGAIEFLGRIDHQVKIRGVRIEPGEIEAQLLTFPNIERALVTVREGGASGKMLVSYVVCSKRFVNNDAELFAKLREHLATRLTDAMMPQAFVRLDVMPLGANGKIDRKALPAPDMLGQSDRAYIAPRNPAEEALVDIWKEVLGIERVGVADNFFDLGGHSLLAVQVLSRLRRTFGIEVPLRRLFEASTIEALALLVEELLIAHLDNLSDEEAEALLLDDETF